MWKKIKDHLKQNGMKYALALLSLLFGADKAAEMGWIGDAPAEYASPGDSRGDTYTVAVAFSLPDGGGAFPAFRDDAGPALVDVDKPSRSLIEEAFREQYGTIYPAAEITGYRVVRRPGKPQEPLPDGPELD